MVATARRMLTFPLTSEGLNMWLISGIHQDASGRIDRVKWRDASCVNDFSGEERVVGVDDIVLAVQAGDIVEATFEFDGVRVAGPRIAVRIDASGRASIEGLPKNGEVYRSIYDLPTFE